MRACSFARAAWLEPTQWPLHLHRWCEDVPHQRDAHYPSDVHGGRLGDLLQAHAFVFDIDVHAGRSEMVATAPRSLLRGLAEHAAASNCPNPSDHCGTDEAIINQMGSALINVDT